MVFTDYEDLEAMVFATATKILDGVRVKDIDFAELGKLCRNALATTGIVMGVNPVTDEVPTNVLNMTASWACFIYMWDRDYDTTDVEGFAKISTILSKFYIKSEYYDYIPDIYTRDEDVTIEEAIQTAKDFDVDFKNL